ncbi:MAG: Multi antimicrobial extrusion protein (Na(+)/drug antiporter), MATE family of MDR efflux pumps [uncultured Thermomicrobiales bacterium]|uniref:Multidrug-efflux transporter n=1 Tax=uncultured Thermomicrobiales bacterium TaxID=1645740 RepID=A0A6J4VB62_9BACT|nr:MAG: Multi antimicrobial extrusion protein (Na(+)/drug antiporter), MATE family of MDR efflux pumps [uncultured Thermomicrobiales bacterium]
MRWLGSSAGVAPKRAATGAGNENTGRVVDRLAWPIIADGLFMTALELTNLALLGRLGTTVISGVGAATQLIQLGIATITGASVGGMVLAAQMRGARDREGQGRIVGQSLLLGLIIGILFGLPALVFANPLLQLIGANDAVAAQGMIYLQITGFAFPALAIMTVAAAILRGLGNSRTPMLITGLTNLINIAVAASLIFGPPQLGVAGAATAAAIARVAGAGLLLATLWRSGLLRGARFWPDLGAIRQVLRIGLPSLGEQLVLNFGLLGYGLMALQLGTTVFAAQRVCLTLIGLAWMPAFGYGYGATALVGQAIGAMLPDRARLLARIAATHAIAWMSGLAVVSFLIAEPLVGLFTEDPEVRSLAATGLRVLCFGQPFWGLGQVYAGALRGAGDTRFPLLATTAGVWFVRLPTAWFFGLFLGWGLSGLFISNSVDAATRAAFVTYRFLRGRWRERLTARAA